jgi:phosphomannomutase
MTNTSTLLSADQIFAANQQVDEAVATKKLSASAAANVKIWLTDRRYSSYAPMVIEHLNSEKWKQLDDAFWTVIPFGTGGRRGRMYPIGSNAINDRTIGESAQGLADYVKATKPNGPWSAAIAYDTRHRSREFSELCAGILVHNGFKVYFIDDYRSTPELSFLIRLKKCDCGIMVTASHNPPSDNAVKIYWSNGAQLIPPHDKAVIAKVEMVKEIAVAPFGPSVAAGEIVLCKEEADAALLSEHLRQSFPGPRDLRVIFSPLHGVGEFNVKSLLNAVGFQNLEIYGPHREPSGDFPNVPGNVSNPENATVFDEIIRYAQSNGSELILASDPDCDRMGAAVPVTTDPTGPWQVLNGNQLSALLCEFILSQRQKSGQLKPENYVVTTLVTTLMLERICRSFGVRCLGQNLVGFKWICNVMDQIGPENFVYGTEESHGFLVGQYCRDKDGAIACMLMSELAAEVKSRGISMMDHLNQLYRKYGFHGERLITIQMEGSDGMRRMQALMEAFRTRPPASIGGLPIVGIRDYLHSTKTEGGVKSAMPGPVDNLIFLETAEPGNYVAARPSGTEPKVKFYMFTFVPPAETAIDLDRSRKAMDQRLTGFGNDLKSFADTIS